MWVLTICESAQSMWVLTICESAQSMWVLTTIDCSLYVGEQKRALTAISASIPSDDEHDHLAGMLN